MQRSVSDVGARVLAGDNRKRMHGLGAGVRVRACAGLEGEGEGGGVGARGVRAEHFGEQAERVARFGREGEGPEEGVVGEDGVEVGVGQDVEGMMVIFRGERVNKLCVEERVGVDEA